MSGHKSDGLVKWAEQPCGRLSLRSRLVFGTMGFTVGYGLPVHLPDLARLLSSHLIEICLILFAAGVALISSLPPDQTRTKIANGQLIRANAAFRTCSDPKIQFG